MKRKLTAHRGASITRQEIVAYLRKRAYDIDVDYPVKTFITETINWIKCQVERARSRKAGL